MKLVHKPLTRWIPALCAIPFLLLSAIGTTREPEYLPHFDPARGFKPAQTNLTEICLQIAGSLEAYGSPEPYLRHIQAEHKRISELYEARMRKPHTSRMPSHLTEDYVNVAIKNWNTLSNPLELDGFAREIGRCAREGIKGTRLTGTLAVQIFNEHQAKVADRMQGVSTETAGYDELRDRLERELEYGKPVDMRGYETTRRDAVSYASVIADRFERLADKINTMAKPEKAALLNEAVSGVFNDLGYLAQSELEIGILESALRKL